MEENCRADLSHSERGASVSASASTEEADVDAGVELRRSSDTSLFCPLWRCETEHERAPLAWPRGPACASWFPFPSPSRWAWNVEVCCSRERKRSCTLSNCKERQVFSSAVFLKLFVYQEKHRVPAQCWTEAAALARRTHCCCSHCCSYECDSRLTPAERGRGDFWVKTAVNEKWIFIAWGEPYLQ